MENLFVPIDDNDILNETCPCGGGHSLRYNSDEKMLECEKCGKFLWSKKYYDKQPIMSDLLLETSEEG